MRNQQLGMSSLNLILVLAVAGFFLMCAFKLVPVYSENQYIVSALESLRDKDKPVSQMSPSEIKHHLSNFYMINGVRSVGSSNIEIERERNRNIITINYEVRVPLIYNISVVVDFQNYMDTSKPEECCRPPVDYRPKTKS
ncbi:DUF4845 domain-containing protein [Simiduia sp. 21SJ11W-1]|uniref:DUF4845 domain-containing protein n=1 Tax=Simiduia sp. 21SJ11W-1 TaxID=2909669 RepID=UPI00209C85E8|nr:DUF4845 domain-containing protein [Simiduia sp. 21SJ11W-1]UTA46284.1 DUF4845 domain-containing protein [Simiduia sp. 21SJ11W-1]